VPLAVTHCFLIAVAAMAAGFAAVSPAQPPEIPVTGVAGPGLERFDAVMKQILLRYQVPGGSLAIARHGKLVLARGYGFSNIRTGKPIEPTSLFRLASVSKSLTAVAILKLVEERKLNLDARVFELLQPLPPPRGAHVDPRLHEVTVRQLLYHSGGWSRETSGDPMGFSRRSAQALEVPLPITPAQLARYMKGQPLDFMPGTRCDYSNFGYMLLGLVIERVAEREFREGVRPYEEFLRESMLKPMGIRRMRLAPHQGQPEAPAEVEGYGPENEPTSPDLLILQFASGGWMSDAVDLARFLTSLDGTRGPRYLSAETIKIMLSPPPEPIKPRANGTYFGMGWDVVHHTANGVLYHKGGGLPGTATHIEHRPNGVNWVVLFNASRAKPVGPQWHEEFLKELRTAIDELPSWPDVDYFQRFP
jgi:N-acyl-D-amino-acid deacylase